MRLLTGMTGIGLCVALCGGATIAATPVADFYSGKRITFVVGHPAGSGSYDQYARMLTRHMGRHIPGQPGFVVQNMPGAGSRKAGNWLYAVAAQDGTVMSMLSQNTAADQALGQEGVQFDVRKFFWIGNPFFSNNTLAVWHTTGVTKIEQAMTRELTVGGSGGSAPSVVYAQVANNLVGTRFKIITGYAGGDHVSLAMERGELDGRGSNSWSSWKAVKSDWLRDNKIHILFQVGPSREPDLPDVPLLVELAKSDEDRRILEFISSDVALGRPVVTAPGVPPERVQALRQAFMATMSDGEFLAEAKSRNMETKPMAGEVLQALVTRTVETPPDVIAKARAAMRLKDSTERAGEAASPSAQ